MRNFDISKRLLGLLLILSAFSCTKTDEPLQREEREIQFFMYASFRGVQLASVKSTPSGSFSSGDQVGVFAFVRTESGDDGKRVLYNAKYTFNGSSWSLANGEPIKVEEGDALNFYAYYPYDPAALDYKSIPHRVMADQSTAENHSNSDLLTARNTETPAGTAVVGLSFSHAHALVEVRLTGDAVTSPSATVKLCGIKPATDTNLSSGEPPVAQQDAEDILMWQIDDTQGNMAYRAIVPSQTIGANVKLIEIGMNNDTYTFTSGSEAIELNPHAVRTLNCNFN